MPAPQPAAAATLADRLLTEAEPLRNTVGSGNYLEYLLGLRYLGAAFDDERHHLRQSLTGWPEVAAAQVLGDPAEYRHWLPPAARWGRLAAAILHGEHPAQALHSTVTTLPAANLRLDDIRAHGHQLNPEHYLPEKDTSPERTAGTAESLESATRDFLALLAEADELQDTLRRHLGIGR